MESTGSLKWRKLVVVASVLFLLTGILGRPVFGDSLTVTGGPPGGNCNQTVTSGSATASCSSATYGDVATASGNLATGIFGVSTSVNSPGSLGSSSSALVTILYNFAVAGAQSGTADFDLTIIGLLSGSTSACFGLDLANLVLLRTHISIIPAWRRSALEAFQDRMGTTIKQWRYEFDRRYEHIGRFHTVNSAAFCRRKLQCFLRYM